MIRNLFIVITFFLSIFCSNAQALSGTYTIGAGGTYPTIGAAVSALTTNGVNGPVIMNILPGTYNESCYIGAIAGTSVVNNVLFKSSTNDSTSVTVSNTTSGTLPYIFKLVGVTHINFKYLTISSIGTYAFPDLISIGYQSTDIKITNCKFNNGRINVLSTGAGTSSAVNNLYIENNYFLNSPNFFILTYSPSALCNNTNIRYNKFNGSATKCMQLAHLSNAFIIGNESNVLNNTHELTIASSMAPITIEKNKFYSTSSTAAIDLGTITTTTANRVTIKNNMVSSQGGFCLKLAISAADIWYNTFKTAGLTSTCMVVNSAIYHSIKNNIFEAVNGYCINYQGSTYLSVSNSNNAYYNTIPNQIWLTSSWWGYTVAQFQTVYPTIESNSVFGQPIYANPGDLHLGISFPQNNAAVPIAGITTDIDNQLRNSTTPDIGADEYTPPTGNNNDIAILKIVSPDTTLCQDQDNLIVRVKNNSFDVFTVFTAKWYLNNVLKSSVSIPVNIQPGDSANVNFGTFDFNEQTFYKLKFEAVLPNGLLDILPANSVKSINYYYVNDLEIKSRKYLECSSQTELAVPQLAYGNYVWSNAQTTNKIIVTNPGTYSVTLQYMGTCTVSDSIVIN